MKNISEIREDMIEIKGELVLMSPTSKYKTWPRSKVSFSLYCGNFIAGVAPFIADMMRDKFMRVGIFLRSKGLILRFSHMCVDKIIGPDDNGFVLVYLQENREVNHCPVIKQTFDEKIYSISYPGMVIKKRVEE